MSVFVHSALRKSIWRLYLEEKAVKKYMTSCNAAYFRNLINKITADSFVHEQNYKFETKNKKNRLKCTS